METHTDATRNDQPARPRGLQGRRRMVEIAREDEAARQLEVTALLASLGREPTPHESALLSEAAAVMVESRRRQAAGRAVPIENRRLVSRNLCAVFGRAPEQRRRRGAVAGASIPLRDLAARQVAAHASEAPTPTDPTPGPEKLTSGPETEPAGPSDDGAAALAALLGGPAP